MAALRCHGQVTATSRVLGVDPGSVRIGLALSDEMGFMAHPYCTIKVNGGDCLTGAPEIAAAALDKEAGVIVIGLPRNMNGTYGPAAEKSRALAEAVKQLTAARVILWDERLTTVAATRSLQETGMDSRAQRQVIDQAAAVQILQSWLDSQEAI